MTSVWDFGFVKFLSFQIRRDVAAWQVVSP
jgi:hypothetical protein